MEIQPDGWPKWASESLVRKMTQAQLDALPEYSTTLPDSYKRPISDGGRPWKRDLNVYGLFKSLGEKMWIYCEYRQSEDPEYLDIHNERIEVE